MTTEEYLTTHDRIQTLLKQKTFLCPEIEAVEQHTLYVSFLTEGFSLFDTSRLRQVEDIFEENLTQRAMIPPETPSFRQHKRELPYVHDYFCESSLVLSKELDDFSPTELQELTSLVVRLAHLTQQRVVLENAMQKRGITYAAAQERAFASLANDTNERWALDSRLHSLYRGLSINEFTQQTKNLEKRIEQLPLDNDFHKKLHTPDAASLAFASVKLNYLKTLCKTLEASSQVPQDTLNRVLDNVFGVSQIVYSFYDQHYLLPEHFLNELTDVLSHYKNIMAVLPEERFNKDFKRYFYTETLRIKKFMSTNANHHQRIFLEDDDVWREEFSGKVLAFHNGRLVASAGEKKPYVYSTLMAIPVPNLDHEIEIINHTLQQQGINPKDCFFSYAHPVKFNWEAFCYTDLRESGYYQRLEQRLSVN